MSKKYELMLLFDPKLSENEVMKKQDVFVEEVIVGNGGSVFFKDFWGKRRLAYNIKGNTHAHYTVLGFEVNPANISKINESIEIDISIIRHLITVTDGNILTMDDIDSWNEENIKSKKNKNEENKKEASSGFVKRKDRDRKKSGLSKKLDDIID